MFIFCRRCGWEQDDFWTKDYNPLRSLLHWEDALSKLDAPFPREGNEPQRTYRDVVVEACERAARIIRTQQYLTKEETPQACPVCGGFVDVD